MAEENKHAPRSGTPTGADRGGPRGDSRPPRSRAPRRPGRRSRGSPRRPDAGAEEPVAEDRRPERSRRTRTTTRSPTPRVKPADPRHATSRSTSSARARRPCAARTATASTTRTTRDSADAEEDLSQPIADAAIDLGAGARYTATGKRKTAVARVILKPGDGTYTINGRTLDVFFPRPTLQRNIRQPLETVGYETRMDVIASMHGGGVSAQAGALRHGISRALIEADPNLRSELKRRGFLTRDARVKERKKAGLKKARKRPQFSKR